MFFEVTPQRTREASEESNLLELFRAEAVFRGVTSKNGFSSVLLERQHRKDIRRAFCLREFIEPFRIKTVTICFDRVAAFGGCPENTWIMTCEAAPQSGEIAVVAISNNFHHSTVGSTAAPLAHILPVINHR